MKIKLAALTTFLMLAAHAASAQTATTEPPSADKIALARQMVEASGGLKQIETMMDATFNAATAAVSANLPPGQKRLAAALQEKVFGRIKAELPHMLDVVTQVYAENLTDKEMRDSVAYMQSESGQSIQRKLPQITAQSIQLMRPMFSGLIQDMRQDMVEQVCKEVACSDQDRGVLAAALDKALPKQPS